MITDFLLSAVFGGINALLSLVPSWSLPDAGSTYTSVLGDLGQFNRVFPVNATITAAAAAITLRVVLTGWDFLVFVYHQFWGGS